MLSLICLGLRARSSYCLKQTTHTYRYWKFEQSQSNIFVALRHSFCSTMSGFLQPFSHFLAHHTRWSERENIFIQSIYFRGKYFVLQFLILSHRLVFEYVILSFGVLFLLLFTSFFDFFKVFKTINLRRNIKSQRLNSQIFIIVLHRVYTIHNYSPQRREQMTMAWGGYGGEKSCFVNEDTSSRRKIFVSKVFDKLRNEKLKLFKTKIKKHLFGSLPRSSHPSTTSGS